ncbi:alanyl-tRNA editing protein [Bacillus suaedae]|uniref:Alanine--tRNA ligase n=1 Tax=Halalkalibacter suaedae TaxID=2822140 RepID=A0A940WX83_9BACI|nr:DHHA1 domain-containing protein [Bacillus suaedae]MBP3952252.1 alanyl-tRNA editing protein [Bacillus suaedae]
MSKKLFYQDQYIRSFTSKIKRCTEDENGRRFVVLEETAFYPTGGGQPHDTGTLNELKVYDVVEVDGEVRHYLQESIDENLECVGSINWERRFDHMQQHAGQHILSAAFEDVFSLKTTSFHLGTDICTIDLDVSNLTNEVVEEVEKLANTVILENRPIVAKWLTADEASSFPLRKQLSVEDNIRIVIIEEFDYNGCGGTHPSSTGQIGSLKILQVERQKKQVRVHFVCGNRVIQQLGEKQKVIQELTPLLNSPQPQMKEAANRILQHSKDLEKQVEQLKVRILEYEAEHFLDKMECVHSQQIIRSTFNNRPISELQQLARIISGNTNNTVVLFVNETGENLQVVCSKDKESYLDMNQLVKAILPLINGKGGGNAMFAQGGGDKTMSAEQLAEAILHLID